MNYGAGYKDDRAPFGRAIVKYANKNGFTALLQFQPFCSFWLL